MVKKKSITKKEKPLIIANTTMGAQWLGQLSEPTFRDQVLKDLFTQMKNDGKIADFLYTHGRNERGVDWIVQEIGGLSQRYVGVQAKAKIITRQGGSNSDSSLSVKQQCESAYEHKFNWHGNEIRLDVVELWNAAHITADAEVEFSTPFSTHKIAVKTAPEIFSLIDQFCPGLVSRIPGLAETGYLRKCSEPEALSIRVLGIHLNPKKHFLEPRFSMHTDLSPSRVFDSRSKKMREEQAIYLADVLKTMSNAIIIGSELSGKTYLLKRISCLVAGESYLPVILDGNALKQQSLPVLLKEHLPWLSWANISDPNALNRIVYLLIDNIDALTDAEISKFLKNVHNKFVVIGTAKKAPSVEGFSTYHFSGIKTGSIHSFVRALDLDHDAASSLTDRATHFINRTIDATGLPINPFTVSVMLSECQIAKRRLATPTMGRLIERFVESQVGSYADTLRADFETKFQFLTHLGGLHQSQISVNDFQKRLARFLVKHGHAHDLTDFADDLFDSGLLIRDEVLLTVRWGHPIFRDFFWVRNLIREKKYKTIVRTLLHGGEPCIAAITGSQMGNAHAVLRDLLQVLEKRDWMQTNKGDKKSCSGPTNMLLPNDDEEEASLLRNIEDHATNSSLTVMPAKSISSTTTDALDVPRDDVTTSAVSLFATRILEDKHYLVSNVAALLVNGRGLSRNDKLDGVLCVLRSNERLKKYFEDMLIAAGKKKIDPFKARSFASFVGLIVNDRMIGDAFLTEIFRELAGKSTTETVRLAITDLRVACGNLAPSSYVKALTKDKNLVDIVSVYMRLVTLYYYRFHKEADKKELRTAMKEIRRLSKGFNLPPVI